MLCHVCSILISSPLLQCPSMAGRSITSNKTSVVTGMLPRQGLQCMLPSYQLAAVTMYNRTPSNYHLISPRRLEQMQYFLRPFQCT